MSQRNQQNNFRLTENNFDLLRLLFAGTVLLVHSYELSGFQQLGIITSVLSSGVAVKAFFVVSGFLIFMSFERSATITSYAKKRIRRIYPAYFTVVMLCAIGLIAVSSKNIGDYFSFAWVKYVFANLAFLNFLQPTLPGVFDSNKLAAINGALWTLKIEAMFYLTVPLFVFLFRKFSHLSILILVYCSSVAYAGFLAVVAERTGSGVYVELGRQLPGQLSYFMAGAFLYYFLPLFERRIGYFLVAAVSILSANMFFPLPILEPFALATVVVFFGLFLYVGNFGKYGDFSYGVYILHFPVIQLLLYSGWFRESPWYFLMAVILITTGGAVAMWHLVEKWFLFRKSHYITATSAHENAIPNPAVNTDSKSTIYSTGGDMEHRELQVQGIRPDHEVMTKQRLPYFIGISSETVNSQGLSMHLVVIPPGAKADPHIHLGYETGIYLLEGEVLTRWGDKLEHEIVSRQGDFLFVPQGVPHEAINLSASKPARAVVARNDSSEQDRVVPYIQK